MFCPKCGSSIPNGAAFCAKCGTAIGRQAPGNQQQAAIAQGEGYWRQGPQAAFQAAPQMPQAPAAQTDAVPAPKRPNPLAKLVAGRSPFEIAKAVGVVVLAICLFLPWFRISIDSAIVAANAQIAQTGLSYQLPLLGDLGITVIGLGDSLNQVDQLCKWANDVAMLTGSSSSMQELASLQMFGSYALVYRLFGLAWIASVVALAAGATMSFAAHKGDKFLRIAAIICAVTSIAGIAIALVVGSQTSNAVMALMNSAGSNPFASYGASTVGALMNDLFGFTLAPVVALAASAAVFLGSFLGQKGRLGNAGLPPRGGSPAAPRL